MWAHRSVCPVEQLLHHLAKSTEFTSNRHTGATGTGCRIDKYARAFSHCAVPIWNSQQSPNRIPHSLVRGDSYPACSRQHPFAGPSIQ